MSTTTLPGQAVYRNWAPRRSTATPRKNAFKTGGCGRSAVGPRFLDRHRRASARVAAQVAPALVPVGQDPALAGVSIHDVHVPRGAMSVAVDQPRIAVGPQHAF